MCQGQEHSEATVVGGPLLDLAAIQRLAESIAARAVKAGGVAVEVGSHVLRAKVQSGPGGGLAAFRRLLEEVDAALAVGDYTATIDATLDGLPVVSLKISLES